MLSYLEIKAERENQIELHIYLHVDACICNVNAIENIV